MKDLGVSGSVESRQSLQPIHTFWLSSTMGVLLVNIVILTVTTAAVHGTHGHSHHQHFFRRPSSFHTFKEITAAVPFSQDYEVELLKPMSQMSQRKHVPVFLVPESSFHIYSPYHTNSAHLSAIEIPLAEPIVLMSPQCEVAAPIGFTVFSQGEFQPFYTVALLAPVPLGTHVSRETPVIVNVLYAVPKLPHRPSYRPSLTQIPASTTTTEKSQVPSRPTQTGILLPPETKPESLGPSDADTVSIVLDDPMNESFPVVENAKESPYLQELRLESLQRQVDELQERIRRIKKLRHSNLNIN